MMNVIKVVLADGVNLEEMGRNWSLFATIAGASFGVGLVIGRSLTKASNLEWRWCFIFNVPVAVVAMVGI